MAGHERQIVFASAMRRSRAAFRSCGGWKNTDTSIPRHAACACQFQLSIRGAGRRAISVINTPFLTWCRPGEPRIDWVWGRRPWPPTPARPGSELQTWVLGAPHRVVNLLDRVVQVGLGQALVRGGGR